MVGVVLYSKNYVQTNEVTDLYSHQNGNSVNSNTAENCILANRLLQLCNINIQKTEKMFEECCVLKLCIEVKTKQNK